MIISLNFFFYRPSYHTHYLNSYNNNVYANVKCIASKYDEDEKESFLQSSCVFQRSMIKTSAFGFLSPSDRLNVIDSQLDFSTLILKKR